jgi:carbon-monoxide dehydrogenase catalytic subunit
MPAEERRKVPAWKIGEFHMSDEQHEHKHGHGDADADGAVPTREPGAAEERIEHFPSKADQLRETPDPAVRQMMAHFAEQGLETVFDRFDAQKPLCTFGLSGACCTICTMGPCRITPRSPRGTCGADADLIVARNLLRSLLGGFAAHGGRSREVMLALKAAATGKSPQRIADGEKVRKMAKAFGFFQEDKRVEELAAHLAEVLLEDLSRAVPEPHRTLQVMAPPERVAKWTELGILPISAYHEAFDALHRTTTGMDGDWRNVLKQFLRCGLAMTFSGVVGGSIAMDCLYGPYKRSKIMANLGTLEPDYVSIAVHGHSPVLVSSIVAASRSSQFLEEARRQGARGIRLYGICCSGLSAMARYGEVYPLANAFGAELAMGTGALDLWVADLQDVYPTIMDVANCLKTRVVTTSDSARLPGAEHIGFDHEHSNLGDIDLLAGKIVTSAIGSYAERKQVPRFVPQVSVEAEVGFSAENVLEAFGGAGNLAAHLRSGAIRGIVNMVGCNNPKVLYEATTTRVADVLLEHDILVLTNGCAGFPLLKLGYCSTAYLEKVGLGLRSALRPNGHPLPPVLHMGECLDNVRALTLFRALADALGMPLPQLPFAFASPEWSNEKGIGAANCLRLHGLNSYHCINLPMSGSSNVTKFFTEETGKTLGSVFVYMKDPVLLGRRIVSDFDARRERCGWPHAVAK